MESSFHFKHDAKRDADFASCPNVADVVSNDEPRRYSTIVTTSFREREKRRDRQENRITLTLFTIAVAYYVSIIPGSIILTLGENS